MSEIDLPTSADWFIQHARMALRLPTGAVVRPTALEVIGAEFKSRKSIRGENILRRPSEAIPDVTFARYPLEVAIALTPPAADLSQPATCAVILLNGIRRIECQFDFNDDQVLIGGEWFPLSTQLIQQAIGILKDSGISALGTLTLKQYLALRQQDSTLVVVNQEPLNATEQSLGSSHGILPPPPSRNSHPSNSANPCVFPETESR